MMKKRYCSHCLQFVKGFVCEFCQQTELKEIEIEVQDKKN
ncbi:RNA polymerase subunit RPABC4/transcription elongation factor Spt4 [Bacillus mesophilus]|nr:RNA polymerase subunit RPABC4/transcription elongation factor Spt4 [Bacillus mesophilus]